MTDLPHDTPSPLKLSLSVAIALALMLLLAVVMVFLYLPSRPRAVNAAIVEERLEKLKQVNKVQAELLSAYAWVDDSHTHVRIPIDKAMQLTLKTINLPPVSSQEVAPLPSTQP
jgi:hypothetical protein